MTRSQLSSVLATLTILTLGSITAAADEPGRPIDQREQQRLERLEFMLRTQQARISDLQSELATGGAQNQDAVRADVMKQQIREVLGESQFRESLMPATVMAGYDKGFFIRSSDDKFYMRMNGRLQFRWTHYGTRGSNRYLSPGLQRNDRTGFDVQRLRLGFRGHAYKPELTYRIEIMADASNSNDARLRYAWANYKINVGFQVMAGIFKIASTRGQMTSSANLQFVDRSVTDAVFQLDRGLGVRFWGRLFDNRLDYYLDIVNAFNSSSNRTITNDPAELDGNPGIVFHLVWHAMGDNLGKDFTSQADLKFHESPALDFGFHYAFNEDDGDRRTTRIPFARRRALGTGGGGFGLTNTNGLQINQFGIESAFKLNGFSATAEYIVRIVDVRQARRPFAPLFILTADGSTTVMHGAYLQMGYFLPVPGYEKKIEAVVRVGGISVLNGGQEGTWEYAAGLNYYIEGNSVKLQTDVTKVSEVPISSSSHSLANVNDDALIWRIQLQFAF